MAVTRRRPEPFYIMKQERIKKRLNENRKPDATEEEMKETKKETNNNKKKKKCEREMDNEAM